MHNAAICSLLKHFVSIPNDIDEFLLLIVVQYKMNFSSVMNCDVIKTSFSRGQIVLRYIARNLRSVDVFVQY